MDGATLAAYVFGAIVVLLVLRVLYLPARFALNVLYHGVIGGSILWSINVVGQFFGIHFALNPISALTVGYLGIPGVGLLFALSKMV